MKERIGKALLALLVFSVAYGVLFGLLSLVLAAPAMVTWALGVRAEGFFSSAWAAAALLCLPLAAWVTLDTMREAGS